MISIHALREEGDCYLMDGRWTTLISIHALREEGDAGLVLMLHFSGNFYPRPPRGGRPALEHRRRQADTISIHALREEGDYFFFVPSRLLWISIHALREEGD